jgi:hypothetical protein
MKSSNLAVAALVAGVALVGAARAKDIAVLAPPAPQRPAGKALVNDPAEPPLNVEGAAAVTGSARGTRLTLNTTGSSQGQAGLTFKNAAPPMRFSLTLAKMPSYNLETLTLSSGNLSLSVGPVSAGPTTRYFDASGRPQDAPERAAYTVTATRWAGGEVDVEIRRAPGATLGKALTVTWKSDLGHGRGLKCCG